MEEEQMVERIERVRARMKAACERCGRDLGDVRLLAVTKKQAPERIRLAAECGLVLMGENRVQEAQAKRGLCPDGLEWHFIGHLQRNKVRPVVSLFSMIHSIDSLRLLQDVNRHAEDAGRTLSVLIQVNVSGEISKFGMPPNEVAPVLNEAAGLMNVEVMGLMTIPPFTPDPEDARGCFRALTVLRDTLREQTGFPLEELSMGMSHDFETAIEEGSTIIRVGTDLFGNRQ